MARCPTRRMACHEVGNLSHTRWGVRRPALGPFANDHTDTEPMNAMADQPVNKYRAAMDILQHGRDLLVDSLAEDVLDQRDNLLEGGYQFHEFLETQGARLHFLGLILGHLEQSAEFVEEIAAKRLEPCTEKPKPRASQTRRRARARPARENRTPRQPPPNSEEAIDETPF